MAYRIPNQTAEDLSARTAIGISIPFSTLFTQTYTTREATRTNLLNYLLTNKKERPLNPSFGSDLSAKVFEPLTEDTYRGLEIQLQEEIAAYFPLVKVQTLTITPEIDNHLVRVNLVYSVLNNENDEINININTEQ